MEMRQLDSPTEDELKLESPESSHHLTHHQSLLPDSPTTSRPNNRSSLETTRTSSSSADFVHKAITGIVVHKWSSKTPVRNMADMNDDDIYPVENQTNHKKHPSSHEDNTDNNRLLRLDHENVALYPVCKTAACIAEGTAILEDISHSAEPCSDFYKFVCSHWSTTRQASPGTRPVWAVDDEILEEFEKMLVDEMYSSRAGYENVRHIFEQCVNGSSDPLETAVEKLLSKVKLVRKTKFDVDATLRQLFRLSVEPLYKLHVQRDIDDPKLAFAVVSEPDLLVGYRKQHDPNYMNFLKNMSVWNNAKLAKYVGNLYDLISLETDIHNAFQKNFPQENHGHKDELQPIRDHYYVINQKIKNILIDVLGEDLTSQLTNIMTVSLKYVDFIGKRNVEQIRPKLMHYLAFRTLLKLAPTLTNTKETTELFQLYLNPWKEFMPPTLLTRQRLCLRWMSEFDSAIMVQMSLDTAYEKLGGKSQVVALLNLIDSVLNDTVREMTADDFELQLYVTEKMEEISWEYLAPQTLTRHNHLLQNHLKLYNSIVQQSTGEENILQRYAQTMTLERHKDALRSDQHQIEWMEQMLLSTEAKISIPYKKLQIPLPVFDIRHRIEASVERYTLIRVATRIFRPLFDALYQFSYHFSPEGKTSSLTNTLYAFRDCLSRQYHKIHRLDNKLRLGATSAYQNLLDALALQAAYKAYIRYPNAVSLGSTRLPKVDLFTPEQLFFIQYGRQFCQSTTPSYENRQIEEGIYAPAWYRVNGPLRNFKPFADAFSCKPNTFMNPINKCNL